MASEREPARMAEGWSMAALWLPLAAVLLPLAAATSGRAAEPGGRAEETGGRAAVQRSAEEGSEPADEQRSMATDRPTGPGVKPARAGAWSRRAGTPPEKSRARSSAVEEAAVAELKGPGSKRKATEKEITTFLKKKRFEAESVDKFLKEERSKVEVEQAAKKVNKAAVEEERLAEFEGEWENKVEEDLVEMFNEEEEAQEKLTTTLKDHYKHWEETGASNFCLGVIKNGYRIKFKGLEEDVNYREKNNKSYFEEKDFANEAVDKMLKFGVVKKVEDAKCVNPLTVATNKVGKRRLCLDLSRKVNVHSRAPKFKIRSLQEAANVVEPGDFGFSFDLRSFYHQIPVREDQRTYLGFAIEREQGEEEIYVFVQMPFGLNDAARCVTKMLKRPLERWRSWGARVAEVHIDDGIVFAEGREFTLALSRRVREDLERHGLLISEPKCAWGARRSILWVGFCWDTVGFQLNLPEEKVGRVLGKVSELKKMKDRLVPIKAVASLCSLLTSLRPALGDLTRFRSRAMLQQVSRAQEQFGWRAKVMLDNKAVDELDFWQDNVRRLNGFPIRSRPGVVDLRQRWFVSDAGEYLAGGVEWSLAGRVEGTEYQVRLTEEQQAGSSTEREMVGMKAGLKLNLVRLQGCEVRWTCDNQAVSIIMRVGSMRPRLQELAMDIQTMCKDHGITLVMDWQPRETEVVKYADHLSKDFDFSDFSISMEDFEALQTEFGPFSCDYFASGATFRMRPFMSKFNCDGSSGVDAFSASWREGCGYFHPPVHRIVDTVRYAKMQRAKGILLVPRWMGSAFWAVIQKEDKAIEKKKFKPFLEAPQWFRNSVFKGRPKFDFAVFELNY